MIAPSAWPADVVLHCKYDAVMTDVLWRTEVPQDGEHRKIVNPRLLTAEGTHAVTYCARPVVVTINPSAGKKRKSEDGPTLMTKEPCGRFIAQDTSPQTLPTWVRRFACYRYNWEVDQVNSCATIMWWMAWTTKTEQGCPALRQYVQDREAVLQQVMDRHKLEYKEAKERITSILMGKYHEEMLPIEDDLWHQCDVVMNAVLRHPEFKRERDKYADKILTERQMFSRLVLGKEREIMECVLRTLDENGYEASALIHDAVLIRRKDPLGPLDLARGLEGIPEEDLFPHTRLLELDIASRCGLHMKMACKSLRPTQEDITRLLALPRDCFTPHDAALEAYFHCAPFLRHAAEGIVMYDHFENIWVLSEEAQLRSTMHQLFGPIAHRLTARAAPGKKSTHFLKETNAARNMLRSLCAVVPEDKDWKNRALLNGRGYLCFRNGYYDFQQKLFIEGPCPEMEFLVGVSDNFRVPSVEEVEMARDFMAAPYSNMDVFKYYMIALARGLAGEVSAKQGYICIGPSNSGKSTVTGALVYAFQGAVGTFDPSNLCNVGGDGDRAKNMGWIVPLEFLRCALGNEIDMYTRGGKQQKINNIQWKVIISGGLDDVPQRLLYKDATSTKINATFFIHANDVPPFSSVDQAVVNRTYVVAQDRKAVERPHGDSEFKMIDNGNQYVRTDAFKNGLRGLLFEAHATFLAEGHRPPRDVLMSTQDRVEVTNPMEQLSELFEIWTDDVRRSFLNNAAAKAAGWAMPRQKLVDMIQKKELGMSPAAVIAELKKHGHVEQVRYSTGNVFIGIRTKIAEGSPGLRD